MPGSIDQLPEDDRRSLFFKLAANLPVDAAQLAESARRSDELQSGEVAPIGEDEFAIRMDGLRQAFRIRRQDQ